MGSEIETIGLGVVKRNEGAGRDIIVEHLQEPQERAGCALAVQGIG